MICLCVGKYWDKRVGGVGDLWGSSVVAESEVVFWGGPAYYATPYGGRSALGMHFNTRRTLLSSRRDLWQALPDTGLSEVERREEVKSEHIRRQRPLGWSARCYHEIG